MKNKNTFEVAMFMVLFLALFLILSITTNNFLFAQTSTPSPIANQVTYKLHQTTTIPNMSIHATVTLPTNFFQSKAEPKNFKVLAINGINTLVYFINSNEYIIVPSNQILTANVDRSNPLIINYITEITTKTTIKTYDNNDGDNSGKVNDNKTKPTPLPTEPDVSPLPTEPEVSPNPSPNPSPQPPTESVTPTQTETPTSTPTENPLAVVPPPPTESEGNNNDDDAVPPPNQDDTTVVPDPENIPNTGISEDDGDIVDDGPDSSNGGSSDGSDDSSGSNGDGGGSDGGGSDGGGDSGGDGGGSDGGGDSGGDGGGDGGGSDSG